MKNAIAVFAVLTLGGATNAHAANLAVISQPPTILNLVVLIVACAAAAVSYRVLSAVRGGQLSRLWQLFIGGFALLAVSQIAMLLPTFEVVDLPLWLGPALMAVCIGLLAYGVFEAKRILA